jgi:tetratricopeptide (TPR) repeat protein
VGYASRGLAYRCKQDYGRALVDMTEAIRLSPKTATLYSNRADAYFAKGEYERGMADINEAIRLSPNDPALYYNRGTAYGQRKDHERAVTDLSRAIHLAPDFSLAYYNRGNAYMAQKAYGWALADFRDALRRDPANVYACFSLAFLLAACPVEKLRDGKQAMEYAKKGCDLTGWRMAGGFQALAAAYAENGDFKEAVTWQKKALDLFEGFPQEERDAIRERLKSYEQGKPCRLP